MKSPIPLSFAQERLWFLDQLAPNNSVYNVPLAVRIGGLLNVVALEQGLNEVVRRHEVLRTTFNVEGGRPYQVVAPSLTLPLPIVDLRALALDEREAQVQRLATEETQRLFSLAQGPLLWAKLLRLGEEEHVLLVTMHHIVSDDWSVVGVLDQELAVLYEAFSKGEPSSLPGLPIQYADYAVWQQEWLQGKVLEALLSYWRERLAGAPPALELPTDRPRPPLQTYRGATHLLMLPGTLSQRLQSLSQREGVTLFMMLLGAFEVLLHRYTGQDDIVVGTPIAGRNRPEIEGLIGFFVNTLVLRTDLSGDPTFRELLGRVRGVTLGAYDHQDLPFERLVEELQPERNLSHNPLFQVAFAFQDAYASALHLPGLTATPVKVDTATALFDLTLFVEEHARGLRLVLEYNTGLFDAETIARMMGHLQTLLEGIVANSDRRLSDLPLLTEDERHQLFVEWNDTATEYPQDQCIHQLFEAQVERTPGAVAVVYGDEHLTYRELHERANQLAHHLQELGIGPEVLVSICVERSLEMVAGILGVLKAGGAYVPLDPSYPKERLAFMLADTQSPVLLTQEQFLRDLPEHKAHVVCLDKDWGAIARKSTENPVSGTSTSNLAYVIYTSGSTGRPKGIAIEHQGAVTLLHWARETFTQESLAGVLAVTSICFDLSIFELFAPLSWGGKVILTESALHLPTLSATEDITLINTVPSVMANLLKINGVPASVRTVNLAGEPLQNVLVQRTYDQNNVQRVFNLYGPSEDTTYSTYALVKRGASDSPPIGRPVANTQVYLLDPDLNPAPVRVSGEVYIGGVGLARGYHKRPELTAENFIPHPFGDEPGARLYKTGDLARYLPDGNIEFLGRMGHQIKMRGFRIELGGIEALLGQHPGIQQVVVVARKDEPGDPSAPPRPERDEGLRAGVSIRLRLLNQQLVAYVVPAEGQAPTTSELRGFLRQKLPEYMVPSAFVELEALPLTPNGKVDRKALPAPGPERPALGGAYVAPRTPVEEALADIWREVLGVEKVGILDSFFELGGHSLLATRVVSRLCEAFDIELPVSSLFESITVAELTDCIVQIMAGQLDSGEVAQMLAQLDEIEEDDARSLLADYLQ